MKFWEHFILLYRNCKLYTESEWNDELTVENFPGKSIYLTCEVFALRENIYSLNIRTLRQTWKLKNNTNLKNKCMSKQFGCYYKFNIQFSEENFRRFVGGMWSCLQSCSER